MGKIESIKTPDGQSLVNVPADPQVLVELGFTLDAATEIIRQHAAAEALELVFKRRRGAYSAESDPIYMEWQYDQAPETEKAWRDKVAEIKTRYPLPTE